MDKLVAQRTALRGSLVKRYNQFRNIIEEINPNVNDLKLQVNKVERTFEKLEEVSDTITNQLTSEEIENDIYDREKYEDYVLDVRVKFESFSTEEKAPSVSNTNVKLPKLEIPKFSGDTLKWLEFFELFECNVDKNSKLSDIEKFSYLRGLVEGKAANTISGLQLSSANYKTALNLLKTRFGSNSKILKAHVRELLNIDAIKYVKNSRLRNFYDTINVHVRALEALGVAQDSYGYFLHQIVLSRLPAFLQLNWARRDPEDNLSIAELMKFLSDECSALEITFDGGDGTKQPPTQKNVFTNIRHSPTQKTTFTNNKSLRQCFLCNDEHFLSNCSKFINMDVDSRKRYLSKSNLCFNCFGHNHAAKNCRKASLCKQCTGKHNDLIHVCDYKPTIQNRDEKSLPTMHLNSKNLDALLPTIKLGCDDKRTKITALLDSGSQISLINKSALKCFNYKIINSSSNLNLRGLNKMSCTIDSPVLVSFNVTGGSHTVNLSATVIDHLGIEIRIKNSQNKYEINTVDLIIGADMLSRVLTGSIERHGDNGISFGTIAGWSNMGISLDSSTSCLFSTVVGNAMECENCDNILKRFWMEEPSNPDDEILKGDQIAMDHFRETKGRCEDGRYIVSWPIKNLTIDLGTCRSQAFKRFQNLLCRLDKDQFLKKEYFRILDEYKELQIVETVNSNEHCTAVERYLPHHPVLKQTSTEKKVRIVFDASSRDENGISLNDFMYTGPCLNPEVLEILIRFRRYEYGIVGDIEKAFLQLQLHMAQRDLTRFFWLDEFGKTIIMRFTRVIFGAKASPFLLAASLRDHLANSTPCELIDILKESLYVDDIVTSLPTEQKIKELANYAEDTLREMQMNPRGWCSNSSIFKPNNVTKKVLGLLWDTEKDIFYVEIPNEEHSNTVTKRNILKFLSSLWDPFGIFCTFTLAGKILMRNLWKLNFQWDEAVPDEIARQFLLLLNSIKAGCDVSINRSFDLSDVNSIEIHAFGDASKDAIGTVVYLKSVKKSEEKFHFVLAKARLSPLKETSTPRLELLAAVQTAKLCSYVQSSLDLPCTMFCWTDSQIVVNWIRGDSSRWPQFVANRIQKIDSLVPKDCWNFVSGKQNPADCISRGAVSFDFLRPPTNLDPSVTPEISLDSQNSNDNDNSTRIVCTNACPSPVINPSNYSSYKRLIRITCWIFRIFKRTFRTNDLSLTAEELQNAENFWIKSVQQEEFAPEIQALRRNESLPKNSKLFNLFPFLDDDGIMRCNRRLDLSDLDYDEKFPILLPKGGHYVKLLVQEFHQRLFHASINRTISEIRTKYWIVHCRRSVRHIIHECLQCRRDRLSPMNVPPPPLPTVRVSSQNPKVFRNIGVDFTGPISIQNNTKIYILLITCTRIRAVHLEVTKGIDLKSCVDALRKCFARRGIPDHIISDNAKTFIAAAKKLEEEFGLKWSFISPASPWRGGFYERLMRSIKEPLKRAIHKKVVQFDDLLVIVSQIEAVVNSRPLSVVNDEFSNEVIITPSHFLVGESLTKLPNYSSTVSETEDVIKIYRGRNDQLKEFWRLFKVNYLKNIRQTMKNKKVTEPVKEGDVVLVGNEKERREWPLGRVERIFRGIDGKIRTVSVKVNGKSLIRPVQRLYLLEST